MCWRLLSRERDGETGRQFCGGQQRDQHLRQGGRAPPGRAGVARSRVDPGRPARRRQHDPASADPAGASPRLGTLPRRGRLEPVVDGAWSDASPQRDRRQLDPAERHDYVRSARPTHQLISHLPTLPPPSPPPPPAAAASRGQRRPPRTVISAQPQVSTCSRPSASS